MLITAIEQCNCLRCSGVIPRHAITRRMAHTHPTMPTRQIITAYCQHCRVAFQLSRVLSQGCWIDDGETQVIEDPRRLKSIIERVQKLENREQALSA